MTSMPPCSAAALRAQMIAQLGDGAYLRSPTVRAAMAAVPRHEFLPSIGVEHAYADQSVITKRDGAGRPTSSASQPRLVALMLEALAVEPGQRVLEIGTGTGYNAALLAELVGPDGHVSSIDVDGQVVAGARQVLERLGYGRVQVLERDGGQGDAEYGPYDRIIVTAGAWDVPSAWVEQLVPAGRLVLPLRWRGQTRGLSLVREELCLRSEAIWLCGFIPMSGPDHAGECYAKLDAAGQVSLTWDQEQGVKPQALRASIVGAGKAMWSGVAVAVGEPFDGIWLRLTASEPATCRFSVAAGAFDKYRPAFASRSPALVEGTSIAYLATRRLEEPDAQARVELGVRVYGPRGDELGERLCNVIRTWGRTRAVVPEVVVYPQCLGTDFTRIQVDVSKPQSALKITY